MFDVKANAVLDQAKQLEGAVVFITGSYQVLWLRLLWTDGVGGASGFGASTAATVADYGWVSGSSCRNFWLSISGMCNRVDWRSEP